MLDVDRINFSRVQPHQVNNLLVAGILHQVLDWRPVYQGSIVEPLWGNSYGILLETV